MAEIDYTTANCAGCRRLESQLAAATERAKKAETYEADAILYRGERDAAVARAEQAEAERDKFALSTVRCADALIGLSNCYLEGAEIKRVLTPPDYMTEYARAAWVKARKAIDLLDREGEGLGGIIFHEAIRYTGWPPEGMGGDTEPASDPISSLKADNARLRKALQEIRNHRPRGTRLERLITAALESTSGEAAIVDEQDPPEWAVEASERFLDFINGPRSVRIILPPQVMVAAAHIIADCFKAEKNDEQADAWTCPACGGCQWNYDSSPDCVTRWCDDCGAEFNPGQKGYPPNAAAGKAE